MSDAVLPAFLILLIVRKPGGDEIVNAAHSLSSSLTRLYGHGDESHVGIWRFLWLTSNLTFRHWVAGAQVQKLGLSVHGTYVSAARASLLKP